MPFNFFLFLLIAVILGAGYAAYKLLHYIYFSESFSKREGVINLLNTIKGWAKSGCAFVKRKAGTILTVTVVAGVTVISLVSNALAALDLSLLTIDTDQVLVLAGIIVAAIAGIWAVKKVIKLANRS